MKKRKIKIVFKVFLLLIAFVVTVCLGFFVVFFKTTSGLDIDQSKLVSEEAVGNIKIFDVEGVQINADEVLSNNKAVNIEELPTHIKQAFVSAEDKRFYKHNGVDYVRVLGAIVNNIKSKGFSQGASTITQQLIKNTHLTREKTLIRKMKEIRLAYKLEKRFSKDEILEMYLNNIYFGNGCYGLESASSYYFNKSAKMLTLGESAMLVGVVNAPSVYNPIRNNKLAEQRKKVVLLSMKKQGYINNDKFVKTAKSAENIVKNSLKPQNCSINTIIDEVCRKINVDKNKLKNMNLNIQTYLNSSVQSVLENILKNENIPKNSLGVLPKYASIIIDNKTKGVVALSCSSGFDVLKDKRMPGSTIKPVLVYAPALEYGLVYPESIIKDEKININGYSPNNANKRFLGNVSVRESIEKSLNVPAVKTLSKVGVERAKDFAANMGISFSNKDKNLALALGGMTDGINISELAGAYSTFASNGLYKPVQLIKKITDDCGNVLYEDVLKQKQVMSKATASLMTDMLKGVALRGTANRLNSLGFDVASKTGTVGLVSSNKNTDAFNVSYTSSHTIISWLGSTKEDENMESVVNGSTYPTLINKRILERIYTNRKPANFELSDDVIVKFIDSESLNNGYVELAEDDVLISQKKLALFNKYFLPDYSLKRKVVVPILSVKMEDNCKPMLLFDVSKDQTYILQRKDVKTGVVVDVCFVKSVKKMQKYVDYSTKTGEIYEYCVKVCKNGCVDYEFSNCVKLVSF